MQESKNSRFKNNFDTTDALKLSPFIYIHEVKRISKFYVWILYYCELLNSSKFYQCRCLCWTTTYRFVLMSDYCCRSIAENKTSWREWSKHNVFGSFIFNTSLHTAIIWMLHIAALYDGVLTWNRRRERYMRFIIIIEQLETLWEMSCDSERPKFWRNADKDILEAL